MQRAFTLIDFLVAVAVFLGVLGLVSINLLASRHTADLSSAVTLLVTDLRLQQFKAMAGDTEGRGVIDAYGAYFGPNSYTVFHGTVYDPGDTANFTVALPSGIQFANVTWPGAIVVFDKGSGEVAGWTGGMNSLQLVAAAGGTTKTVTVNRYGVVDYVN